MKFLNLVFVFVFVFVACNKMESSEPVSPERNLIASAEIINKAVLDHDYTMFAKYTHPKIVEMLGGEQKFKQMTENGAKAMDADGAKFVAITNGEPGKIITTNGELQSTLPQTIEIKIPQGKVKTKITVIAVSKNNGKNWVFINTTNTDLKKLQAVIPTLSNELVIPPTQQPEMTPDK